MTTSRFAAEPYRVRAAAAAAAAERARSPRRRVRLARYATLCAATAARAIGGAISFPERDRVFLASEYAQDARRYADIAQTGYLCRHCNGPAPVGVGYVSYDEDHILASMGRTACPCRYSRDPLTC